MRHDSHESYTIVKPVQIPTQFLQTNARLLPSLYGKLYCGGGNNAVLDESVKMGLGYLHLPGFVSLSLFIFYRTRGSMIPSLVHVDKGESLEEDRNQVIHGTTIDSVFER